MAEEEIPPVHYEDLANIEAEFDGIDNEMGLYHRSALTNYPALTNNSAQAIHFEQAGVREASTGHLQDPQLLASRL